MSDFATLKSALEVELKAHADAVEAASKTVEVKDNTVYVDPESYNAAQKHKETIFQLKDLMMAEKEGKDIQDWLNAPAENPVARVTNQPKEMKSVGDQFIESDEFKDVINSNVFESKEFNIDIPDIIGYATKDVYNAVGTYNTSFGIGTVRSELPWVQAPQLRQRIRDLFPTNTTSSNLIEFFRVLGLDNDGRGQVATVPDYSGGNFGLKPKSDLVFESDAARVRTIAHWIAVHRSTLADKAQIRSVINNQLFYGLALEEDDQLLNGDGTGENIRGLLHTPGIQTYNAPAAELRSDSLRKAQTLSTLALFPATGYILHPNDWQEIEIQKGETNDHYMLVTNVAVGAQSRIWRLPVVESPTIEEGTFLTGAFGQAAQIWDRERANIKISEHHADYFVRNAVAVLAEERLALTVTHPAAIIAGEFAA